MYEITTEGMTCNNCVKHVEKAVKSIDPKADVQISLSDQKVLIESEGDRDAITAAIEEAGYRVRRTRWISARTQ